MQTNSDFEDLLLSLNDCGVEYLIVGGIALAFHDRPRYTQDLDIWVARSEANAARTYAALERFGAPVENISQSDLERPDLVYQVGVAPVRVDILTSISGIEFPQAWPNRIAGTYGSAPIFVIGKSDLLCNKRATGRPQDLADVARLESASTGL